MGKSVNPDLAKARSQATFDPANLTNYLYGGPEKLRRKRYLPAFVFKELCTEMSLTDLCLIFLGLLTHVSDYLGLTLSIENMAAKEYKEEGFKSTDDMSREEAYEESMRRAVYTNKRVLQLNLQDQEEQYYFREIFVPGANPFALHYVMFKDAINTQGTEDQIQKWLPLAETYAVTGTYAQTELGHGTFLRGLETTAEYDVQREEFILNTPTITSSKFWPGALGKTANVAILNAKLITKGRNCGMQSFWVPLRHLETHQPLPGITVGDIGPKFGYHTSDNGFLQLNRVRIPRENMLMRYSKVLQDGTFVPPENDRLVYVPMTQFRFVVIGRSGWTLAKAVTVATRYSAVRRQSEITPGGGEVQILDFQTQQHKLFTQIASAYAMIIAAKAAKDLYDSAFSKMEKGNLEDLPMLHALTSSMKAFNTWEMATGVEQCRMACGGHGYLLASGIPQMYTDMVSACTYEGENTVMCLQAARFLNKCQEAANKGERLPQLTRFLQTSRLNISSSLDQDVDLNDIIAAYEFRAATVISEANARLNAGLAMGKSQSEAWNYASQLLVKAALAFSHWFTVRALIENMRGAGFDNSTETLLLQLAKLYALDGMLRYSGDFRKVG
ncbi:acyl-coenzyme A oxidase [Elysia marginata]|uniref:Acyl-coenzyme A oxidase n=1 Tax=Elysia marginata TaxID=1093978 RepID=A0AAV4GAA6_9GAST|nr:acyl-coenzyme A oxidase [Elysia marginata]